jgi:hypothetical protein
VALDLRAHRFRRAALLHAARKGVREDARASGPRSRARVHRRRCSCCRYIVRASVPVLRSADRSCGAAAQDIAGDYPKYHASGDDRTDHVSDRVSDGVPNGVSDSFTVRLCDGIAVKAFQHAGFASLSARRLAALGGSQHFSKSSLGLPTRVEPTAVSSGSSCAAQRGLNGRS